MDKINKPAAISVAATALLCIAVFTLLVLFGGLAWWLWGADRSTDRDMLHQIIVVCFIVWGVLLSLAVPGFMAFRLLVKDKVPPAERTKIKPAKTVRHQSTFQPLKEHLRTRYGPLWRLKVRLLLVVGEDAAVAALVPGLREKQWLEGGQTVLIYGGSLSSEIDEEKLTALRKPRRSRPLDGIILALSPEQELTAQANDTGLRTLEKIGRVLCYQPPVWLWQLCKSDWPQTGRTQQPVGAFLPHKAVPEEVTRQLSALLPQLREQGLAQLAENQQYDFLLRLGQQLEQGESARWQQRLTPWLQSYQQRIPLRGLMFSLPNPSPVLASGPHDRALILPTIWQGVVKDSQKARGRRVGMPWQQTLACTVIVLLGLWGTGMLVSFIVNRHQIISVADKARQLVEHPAVNDEQLIALHSLRNDAGRMQHYMRQGASWYQRFGLDHNPQLLAAMLPWYGVVNERLIRDPAREALLKKLTRMAELPPASPLRAELAKPGYDELKAWLMMVRPEKADATFYAQTMKSVEPKRQGISDGLWQSLAPDLWAFYASLLPSQPQWKITVDAALLAQTRQVLLEQIGHRNAESTLYQNMLASVRRNYADMSLEDMTNGTDARRLFSTSEVIPGMFTRQTWESSIQKAIDNAVNSRRDEIDWVLSDNRQNISADISPEALKARLTDRYFTDFSGAWQGFLNSLRLNPASNIADVTDQLTLISDVRQSPLIAMMNTLAWQGQTGQKNLALSDSLISSAKDLLNQKDKPAIDQRAAGPVGPLDETFGPLLTLMGKNTAGNVMSADNTLSLQTYLTRITRVRLRLQQVASASDPQEMMQTLAQTVFQGKSVDLTDTRQYGSLIAASLGEEWSGFGQTMFVQPLTQAWETVLQPSASSLNDKWRRAMVNNWQTAFDGRYPFAAVKSDASLPMLAEFIRKDSGRIDRFLASELSGVLHKESSQWVPNKAHSQGLSFNPAFLKAVNQLSRLSDILFTDGSQGISFELQARPTPDVVETQLVIDGQKLRYFNQMAEWEGFRWPGNTWKPGTMLTWTSTKAGARIFGDYSGTWGFIRWLERGKRRQLDRSQWMMSYRAPDGRTLQWVLRTQLEKGPLALLELRGFTLPDKIFSVDQATADRALSGAGETNDIMDGEEQ